MADFDIKIGDVTFDVDDAAMHQTIRHLPAVVDAVNAKAREMLSHIPSDEFDVLEAGGPQRYRAYVRPSSVKGYHQERKHSYILKALAAMVGR